jgi:cytochrome bd ubiquinol oxidase subunit II
LQQQFYTIAKRLLPILTIFLILVSLWTPLVDETTKTFWFDPDHFYKLACLPFATAILLSACWWSLQKQQERYPFWLTIGIFLCAYTGFLLNSWPYLVPHEITYWQAAAPRNTLQFMLIGVIVMLPILMYYTCSAYYIFRGKVKEIIKY